MKPATLTRREFSIQMAMLMLGGASITISACGGGGGGGGGSPTQPGPGDKVGFVAGNHGHVAVISAAELNRGGGLTLDIRGMATHPHSLDLTAAEVTAIRDGSRVSKLSSTEDLHDHTVTFN